MGDNNMGTLTNTQRKVLTEMLGEKWIPNHGKYKSCGNRTFDTWQDFGDVVHKISQQQLKEVLFKFGYFEYSFNAIQLAEAMQQPDFIELFMRAVVEMKKIEIKTEDVIPKDFCERCASGDFCSKHTLIGR